MNITEGQLVVHCSACGARWELDNEPTACECDYGDPDAPVAPWTVTVEPA